MSSPPKELSKSETEVTIRGPSAPHRQLTITVAAEKDHGWINIEDEQALDGPTLLCTDLTADEMEALGDALIQQAVIVRAYIVEQAYYIHEDDLPILTEEQYGTWFDASWVHDGVRIGPRRIIIAQESGWDELWCYDPNGFRKRRGNKEINQ